MMRYIMSYGVALALLLIIAGWLASGTLIQGGQGAGQGEKRIIDLIEPEENGPVRRLFVSLGLIEDPQGTGDTATDGGETSIPSSQEEEPEKLQSVRAVHYEADMMPLEVSVRGQTNANAIISVRAETSGIVKQVHVEKGQTVAPGDLLCTLDQGTRLARLRQAEAALAQAQASLERARADFETNAALREKGLAAANTARQYEVNLRAAEASEQAALSSLDDIRDDLEKTRITAEVGGIVQDPLANVGDMMNVSGVCATIVELNPILFSGRIAEARISLVRTGLEASVTTVTGQTVQGVVSYVSPSADRATRAFEVEIRLDNSDGKLRDGVTATATIQAGAIPAHLIPQSALTLDTEGTLGVRVVEGDVARFMPVTIAGDTPRGIWVSGLPPVVNIITLGQEYVSDGQKVIVSMSEDAGNEDGAQGPASGEGTDS